MCPASALWTRTREKQKKALPCRTQIGFTKGKQKAIPKGMGPAKLGVLPGSLCLSPDTSCHLQPGRGCRNQANRPSACGLGLTRWLITGHQQHLPTQSGVHRGRGEVPTVYATMTLMSLSVPCLAVGGRPGVGSRSLVPGRSSCQHRLEDREAAFGDLSMLCWDGGCRQAPTNCDLQIVSSLQTICK